MNNDNASYLQLMSNVITNKFLFKQGNHFIICTETPHLTLELHDSVRNAMDKLCNK